MKKIVILFLAISGIAFGQEDIVCSVGNDTNGFGLLENTNKSIINAGFRTNGVLNGSTFLLDKNGHYIFSNFKNGIPTGNSVYYIGEGSRQHGVFENGMKEGVHILINDLKFSESILITYKNDKEISRKTILLQASKLAEGCQGDCENGYGAKVDEEGMLLIGFFKNGNFYRGEILDNEKRTTTIYNKSDNGREIGVYTLMDRKPDLIEEFKVVLYSEDFKNNYIKNTVLINREAKKVMASEYDDKGVKKSFKNF